MGKHQFDDLSSDNSREQNTEKELLVCDIYDNYIQELERLAPPKTSDSFKSVLELFDGAFGKPQIVEKLPADFSGIPVGRQSEIDAIADEMLLPFSENAPDEIRDKDGFLNFTEIGAMMDKIAQRQDLSEIEKCYLWSSLCQNIDDKDITVHDCDEAPEMIDSWVGRLDTAHAILPFTDRYHAGKLFNMSPEDASATIVKHEDGSTAMEKPLYKAVPYMMVLAAVGINEGDINASEGQLKALRALMKNGQFSDYANEWKKQFVRVDAAEACEDS